MQLSHVSWKTSLDREAGDQLSKRLAGNDVREEQPDHADLKDVAAAGLSCGKDERESQPDHVYLQSVDDEISMSGNDSREEQPNHDA